MATALAYRMQEHEGFDVRVFSESEEGKEHLLNIVEHVTSLDEGLRWVGRDGYIIRDDEKDMSNLRKMGFKVYGGNSFTQKIENDRVFEMEVAKEAGIKIPNYHAMESIDEGIAFVKKHPDAWSIKQMGHAPKEWNFIGKDDDGYDVILQLEWIKTTPQFKKMKRVPFMLQEVVVGHEFATSAWWMAGDWKRDDHGDVICEINFEHKKMLNDNLGISCGEMGTLGMITTEYNRLFTETVERLTPVLKKKAGDVIINIDCNCGIVDEKGKPVPYLFEITPREGYPFQSLFIHLLSKETAVGEFMSDLIDKKQGNVGYSKLWGIVTVIGTGDFPHESESKSDEDSFKGQPVRFETDPPDAHIHPGYIMYDPKEAIYRVADNYAMVATVTYDDADIETANKKCVETMKRIDVRSPVFRTDIGKRVLGKELDYLIDHDYAPPLVELRKIQMKEEMPDYGTDLDESEQDDEGERQLETHEV